MLAQAPRRRRRSWRRRSAPRRRARCRCSWRSSRSRRSFPGWPPARRQGDATVEVVPALGRPEDAHPGEEHRPVANEGARLPDVGAELVEERGGVRGKVGALGRPDDVSLDGGRAKRIVQKPVRRRGDGRCEARYEPRTRAGRAPRSSRLRRSRVDRRRPRRQADRGPPPRGRLPRRWNRRLRAVEALQPLDDRVQGVALPQAGTIHQEVARSTNRRSASVVSSGSS